MKFEPKRVTAESQSNLGGIRKNSANKWIYSKIFMLEILWTKQKIKHK